MPANALTPRRPTPRATTAAASVALMILASSMATSAFSIVIYYTKTSQAAALTAAKAAALEKYKAEERVVLRVAQHPFLGRKWPTYEQVRQLARDAVRCQGDAIVFV